MIIHRGVVSPRIAHPRNLHSRLAVQFARTHPCPAECQYAHHRQWTCLPPDFDLPNLNGSVAGLTKLRLRFRAEQSTTHICVPALQQLERLPLPWRIRSVGDARSSSWRLTENGCSDVMLYRVCLERIFTSNQDSMVLGHFRRDWNPT